MSWPNGKLMTCYPTSCVEALTPATYSPKVNKNTIFSWFLVVCGRLVHGHPNLFSYLGLTVHPRFSLHVYRFLWSYIGPSSVISGLFPPDMIYKWNLKVKIPVATLRPFRALVLPPTYNTINFLFLFSVYGAWRSPGECKEPINHAVLSWNLDLEYWLWSTFSIIKWL